VFTRTVIHALLRGAAHPAAFILTLPLSLRSSSREGQQKASETNHKPPKTALTAALGGMPRSPSPAFWCPRPAPGPGPTGVILGKSLPPSHWPPAREGARGHHTHCTPAVPAGATAIWTRLPTPSARVEPPGPASPRESPDGGRHVQGGPAGGGGRDAGNLGGDSRAASSSAPRPTARASPPRQPSPRSRQPSGRSGSRTPARRDAGGWPRPNAARA
jgi:hypothetical protein